MEDVATYTIISNATTPLTAGANYDLTVIPGTMTINQANLIITADINGKDHGEVDPLLTYTITEGALALGDEFTGELTRVGEETSWGEEVGPYLIERGDLSISGVYDNGNYNFTVVDSWFYINPYGPGTRAIKPVLNCVVEIGVGSNHFIANFAYKNDNDEDVFIPTGLNNLLEGEIISITDITGTTTLDHQPTLFEQSGGEFRVEFIGDELRWIVNSLDQNHKASNSASANSNSTKCNTQMKSAKVSTAMEEEDLMEMEDLMVYPNPVTNKVNLVMKDIQDYKMIMLLDVTGRAYPITNIKTRSDRMEIDMTNLPSGPYFIRVVMEDTTRVIQVIKL